MPMIELFEGFFVSIDEVAVVKSTGDAECALFTSGQSAIDEGFRIPYSAAEVAEKLNDAENELYDEEDEEEEEGK